MVNNIKAMRGFYIFILIALSAVDRIEMQDIEPEFIPKERTTSESALNMGTETTITDMDITTNTLDDSSTISQDFTTTGPQTESTPYSEITEATTQGITLTSDTSSIETIVTQASVGTAENPPTTEISGSSTENGRNATILPTTTMSTVTTSSTTESGVKPKPSKRPNLSGTGIVCRKLLGEPRLYYNYWSPNGIAVVRPCHLCCSICGKLQYCLSVNTFMCGI